MAANGGNGSSGDPIEKLGSILSGGPDDPSQQKSPASLQAAPQQGALAGAAQQQGGMSPELLAWIKAFAGQFQGAQG